MTPQELPSFVVTKDLMKVYSEWQFSDVKGFRVGDWMQEDLDMAAQVETTTSAR